MKKNGFNSEFIDLIKDDGFVKLVTESVNTEQLLMDLLLQNPGNSNNIKYAFEFILLAKEDRKELDKNASNAILKNIQTKLDKTERHVSIFHRITRLKAASVILFFFAVGTLYFYHQLTKDPLKQFAEKNVGRESQSMIILSNGVKHILSDNNSKIDYNSNQGEVIVRKQKELVAKLQNTTTTSQAVLNQVVVPFGQHQRVVLSDGTVVELNAGSKLVFPAAFSGDKRNVYLKGEGYFEVRKDSLHPFVVQTDFMNVKVLGTVFNVSAYEDESVASTVLVEGSVSISQRNKIMGNQSYLLSPGQGCFYSVKYEKSAIKNVDTDIYTSWKDGVYRFNDVPLFDVIRKVMKYYNVPIQVQDGGTLETKLSGKLMISGNIDEVMSSISKTLECRYEKNEDGIFIIKN